MKTTPTQRIAVLVSIVLVAFISGYVGGLAGQQYYDTSEEIIRQIQEITRPRTDKTQDQDTILQNTAASMVSIYDTSLEEEQSFFSQTQKTGYGIALSADGWIIAPTEIIGENPTENRVVVDGDRNTHAITDHVPDTATGLSFIKIEATNLRAAAFASEKPIVLSQQGFLISNARTISSVQLGPSRYPESETPEQTTQSLAKIIPLQSPLDTQGLPVTTPEGEIVGLTGSDGVIPIRYIQNQVSSILRNGTLNRIALKLDYLDNAWIPNNSEETQFPKTGATILTKTPLTFTTPEGQVQLKQGDVILSINNELVDINRNASELLQQYSPSDTVRIKIRSNEQENDFTIILD